MVCAFGLAAIPACGGSSGGAGSTGGGSTSAGSSGQAEALSLPFGDDAGEASGAAYTQPKEIKEAQLAEDAGGQPAIDVEHVSDGYVTAQAKSPARLKFQVNAGDQTYNYDLPSDGTQTVYPLNMGDGSYTFRIMQNTSGSNYVELFADAADVSLDDEFGPFLVPNLFCSYTADSACIDKARDLTKDSENVGQVVQAVCTFVADNVSYDNAKAEELAQASGYVPDPDDTLESGTGICLDYASLSAAMLRSMGIPTKVMTGYVGQNEVYHAWIMVYIDGTWKSAMFDVQQNTWSRCDVTFASTGATQYVGDASAYTDRYTY